MRVINVIGEITDELTKEVLEKIFEVECNDNKILEENKKMANEDDYKKLEDLTVNITSVGGIV